MLRLWPNVAFFPPVDLAARAYASSCFRLAKRAAAMVPSRGGLPPLRTVFTLLVVPLVLPAPLLALLVVTTRFGARVLRE